MINKVLVSIDPSPTAARALETAADLARGLHAQLTVMTVVPGLPAVAYQVAVDTSELERDIEQESQKLLREAVDGLPDDLGVGHVLRHGHAAEEILKELDEGGHDLLVMGSRGRGRLASNVLGSVSAAVHFHSHVPVLTVPPEGDAA